MFTQCVQGNCVFLIHTAYVRSCFTFAKLRIGSQYRDLFGERKLTDQIVRSKECIEIIRTLMLKCFSLIGEEDCSYEYLSNISAYLNAKRCLKRNKVANANHRTTKRVN